MNNALNDIGNCYKFGSGTYLQLDWIVEQELEDEALRKEVAVEKSEYMDAIQFLVAMAQKDSLESKTAALLLLSIANDDWKINLADFNYLSYKALQCVLLVIRGAYTLMEKPQNLIPNGPEIFSKLEEDWKHLSTQTC
jgi:hypothetical protein